MMNIILNLTEFCRCESKIPFMKKWIYCMEEGPQGCISNTR